MGRFVLFFAGAILVVLAVYIITSRMINKMWLKRPSDEGKFLDSGGKRLFYRARGKGDPVVIILHDSGSTCMEWWPVQNKIQNARVITFERPGYGWSSGYPASGAASDISDIIDSIIRFERIKKPVILVADGAASIYAHHYACTRPEKVAGAVLFKPIPVDYRHWRTSLNELGDYKSPEEIARKRMILARLGLFRLVSPYRRQPARFKYGKLIAEFYNDPASYSAAITEHSMIEKNIDEIRQAGSFPKIPLTVLFPGEESLIRQWVRNGTPDYTARQAARMYRILSRDNLYLSPRSKLVELHDGVGPLHLEDPAVIASHINSMIKSLR